MKKKKPLRGTAIFGIGLIAGVACMIEANKFTVKGGTSDANTLRRAQRAMMIANTLEYVSNFISTYILYTCANLISFKSYVVSLPCIRMVESGGANLTEQFDVFHTG